MKPRSVARVIEGLAAFEGEGFLVHRPFPSADLPHIDPFLLLDEMGPASLSPLEARGAPDHPHRGFETVTYVLEGSIEHLDSTGKGGRIEPGDVQWMTAGRGVIHSEMPGKEIQRDGGRLHAIQLWVNLPRASKMTEPRYQEIASETIPEWDREGVRTRLIAGELPGRRAPVETTTPIVYAHLIMDEGSRIEFPVPEDWNAFAWVLSGAVETGGSTVAERNMLLFRRDGDSVVLESYSGGSVMLAAGKPLGEPVARFGPFVMSTREEIVEAWEDFQAGRFDRER